MTREDPVTEIIEPTNVAGWTFETLRIHLLSIMNEREKAHDKAIAAALVAVKDGRANTFTLSIAGSTVIGAIIALITLLTMSHH
jgi:hypothetical protein